MLLIPGEPIVVLSRDPHGLPPQTSGAPAIAAWVAASLGTPTAFVGSIGDDAAGDLMRSTLRAVGADALAIKVGEPTATAHVDYAADGSRSFEFRLIGSAATLLQSRDLGDRPEQASWVHVSGSSLMIGGPLRDTVLVATARAKAAGATISVDPNLRAELTDPEGRTALRTLCASADVLFPSETELDQLQLEEEELTSRGVVVCRTMAAGGARLVVGDVVTEAGAVARQDEVVDPDGAGDTFAAAVIAARLAGLDWPLSLTFASEVVARAIAVPGPMTADLSPCRAQLAELRATTIR